MALREPSAGTYRRGNLAPIIQATFTGPNGETLTQEEIERRRAILDEKQARASQFQPVTNWAQGASMLVDAFGNVLEGRRLDRAAAANRAEGQEIERGVLDALGGMRSVTSPALGGTSSVPSASSPAGGARAAAGDLQPAAREDYAMNYLIGKGLAPHQAAGFVGNLIQESSLNTGARNPGDGRDGSDSIGIMQANGDRARNLMAFAQGTGRDLYDLDTQLDFALHEMAIGNEAWRKLPGWGSEGRSGQALRNAQDVQQAAAAGISYERPAGWALANPTAGHGWENRVGHASRLAGMSWGGPQVAAAQPSGSSAPVQVASLDPYAGVAEAFGSSPRNAAAATAEIAPQDVARIQAAPRDPNAVPYNGPGATIEPSQVASLTRPVGPVAGNPVATALLNPASPRETRSLVPGQDPVAAALFANRSQSDPWGGMREVGAAVAPSASTYPVANGSQVGSSSGGSYSAIIRALTSPNSTPAAREIAGLLIQQEINRNDPMKQAELAYRQAQTEALRNPQSTIPAGYQRTPSGLAPIPGGPADPAASWKPDLGSIYVDGREQKGYFDRNNQWVPVGDTKAPAASSGGVTISPDGTVQVGGGGIKVPSGFMPDPANPMGVVPIPGGPADQLPAELAGRIAIADSFLGQVPDIQKEIEAGGVTGLWDRFQAGNNAASAQASTYRKLQSGADALQRLLTGAGMTETEAAAYAQRYLPTYTDDSASALDKLNQVAREVENARAAALRGRGGIGANVTPNGAPTGQQPPAVDYRKKYGLE